MNDKVCTADSFEECAVLLCRGFQVAGATQTERGRVAVAFHDEDGAAEETLRAHQMQGVEVNSQDFEQALRRAKALVFAAKDGRPADGVIHGQRFR